MSTVEQFKIGDKSFNVTRATAVNQKKLMTLIGPRILANSVALQGEIDKEFVFGVLLNSGEKVVDEVADLVLWKTVESGSDVKVSIDTWSGGMVDWFTLLAEAVKFNLQDFFTWLDKKKAEATNKESVEKSE